MKKLSVTLHLPFAQVYQSFGDNATAASQTQSDGQRMSGGAAIPKAEQRKGPADQRDCGDKGGSADGFKRQRPADREPD